MIKCPECSKEIVGKECPKCGEDTPQESIFCMCCGEKVEEDSEDTFNEDDSDIDFKDRVLCSDGACTGIIIDGKCCECGKSR
ncbi:hypothetical protein ACFL6W_06085 [Thermodesulfobacteriota bacterium]